MSSSVAIFTNLPMLLRHRPQQLSSSSMPREQAKALGQVIPACPSARTSDSLMPLHTQTNTTASNEYDFDYRSQLNRF